MEQQFNSWSNSERKIELMSACSVKMGSMASSLLFPKICDPSSVLYLSILHWNVIFLFSTGINSYRYFKYIILLSTWAMKHCETFFSNPSTYWLTHVLTSTHKRTNHDYGIPQYYSLIRFIVFGISYPIDTKSLYFFLLYCNVKESSNENRQNWFSKKIILNAHYCSSKIPPI